MKTPLFLSSRRVEVLTASTAAACDDEGRVGWLSVVVGAVGMSMLVVTVVLL